MYSIAINFISDKHGSEMCIITVLTCQVNFFAYEYKTLSLNILAARIKRAAPDFL